MWPGAGRRERAPRARALCLGKGNRSIAHLWPGRWPARQVEFPVWRVPGGPLVPALPRASPGGGGPGGGGNPRVLGDSESLLQPSCPLGPFPDPRKGLHLGPSINSALLVHIWKGPGAEARSVVIWAEQGWFPGGLGVIAILGRCGSSLFSFLVRGHFATFAEGYWETRALSAIEPGAKDPRVGLVWPSLRGYEALWEGDFVRRDVRTCVLSLLEDAQAGSSGLADKITGDLKP